MAASQTLRTLKLSLLADVSDFGKGMGRAGSDFQKFSRTVDNAARVATGVIGAIGGIAVSAIQAASDLSETSSAVEQVFGRRSAAQLQTFAANAAQALGQSRQDALQAAQQFGVFGQAAGLAGDDLVDFTTDLVTLASDLASFNNTSVDQAINALGAALRGESEPIRTYGVLLDAATLQARAFAEGIIDADNTALTPAQKTLAAYLEILDQTTLQQGDFQRTSDGLANSQKSLKAELENFRVELGEELTPVVQTLLPLITGWVEQITAVPPEQLVAYGEGILKIGGAIVALNAALRVFTTLSAAWTALTTFGAAIAGGSLAAGGGAAVGIALGSAYVAENLDPVTADRLAGIGRGGRVVPQAATPDFSASAGRRPTGNVQVNVTGVVGSVYQVQREIERQLAAAERNRLTVPGSSR